MLDRQYRSSWQLCLSRTNLLGSGEMHMCGRSFVSVVAAGGLALVFAELVPVAVAAEDVVTAEQPAVAPGADTPPSQSAAASPMPAADPVIVSIRSKLGDASLRKGAHAKDLAALDAFYAERSDPPVWITPMGFSAKAQTAINEIGKADDWGLSAAAFELPPAGDLPKTADARAVAEIKLQLAVLKYARFARGGRVDPSTLSELIDQDPPLLDPKIVLTEIAAAPAPDAYLQSLHPKHEQFQRLHQALLKARGVGDDETAKKPRNEHSSICTTPSGLTCSSRRCVPSAITVSAWRSRVGWQKILLTEDKGWDAKKVEDLIDKGYDSAVNLDHQIPVHTTYFTAVVDNQGKVTNFPDIYALDRKVAPIVGGRAIASAAPADGDAAPAAKPKPPKENIAGSIQGLFGD